MFRQRRRLFVTHLGWRVLDRGDDLEIDAFDGPTARYIAVLDGAGALCGSARFLPTTEPHLMSEHFTAFVDGAIPRAPDILEWSRHAPGDPALPPEANTAARAALHLALLEFALAEGVRAFTALMDRGLVRRAQSFGWECRPLGPPAPYAEGEAVAILNPVRAAHLDWLRERVGTFTPVLVPTAAAAA
jgi:acyl-homoserine lactone synthase